MNVNVSYRKVLTTLKRQNEFTKNWKIALIITLLQDHVNPSALVITILLLPAAICILESSTRIPWDKESQTISSLKKTIKKRKVEGKTHQLYHDSHFPCLDSLETPTTREKIK